MMMSHVSIHPKRTSAHTIIIIMIESLRIFLRAPRDLGHLEARAVSLMDCFWVASKV